MSILSAKTDPTVIKVIKRALKVLENMPADVAMTKDDDFELSLATNMLKSIVGHNDTIIEITQKLT